MFESFWPFHPMLDKERFHQSDYYLLNKEILCLSNSDTSYLQYFS